MKCRYYIATLEELEKKLEIPQYYPQTRSINICRSIDLLGILQPIIVEEKDGKWILRDGYNRYICLRQLNRDVPVLICDGYTDTTTIALNYIRGKTCGNRILQFVHYLYSEKNVKLEDIANALVKSVKTVKIYINTWNKLIELAVKYGNITEFLKHIDSICPSIRRIVKCVAKSTTPQEVLDCITGVEKPVKIGYTSEELKTMEKLYKQISNICTKYNKTRVQILEELLQYLQLKYPEYPENVYNNTTSIPGVSGGSHANALAFNPPWARRRHISVQLHKRRGERVG